MKKAKTNSEIIDYRLACIIHAAQTISLNIFKL